MSQVLHGERERVKQTRMTAQPGGVPKGPGDVSHVPGLTCRLCPRSSTSYALPKENSEPTPSCPLDGSARVWAGNDVGYFRLRVVGETPCIPVIVETAPDMNGVAIGKRRAHTCVEPTKSE